MASPQARAHAVADLESMGYSCSLDEHDGVFLVDVDHHFEDAAAVRCLVMRAAPDAAIIHR
jgi:hypothetical protein